MNEELDIRPNFIILADSYYQKIWETLSEAQKQLIENQATLRSIDSKEKANRFLESRMLFENKQSFHIASHNKINESQSFSNADPVTIAMGMLWNNKMKNSI